MRKPRSLKHGNTTFEIQQIIELNWEKRRNEDLGLGVNGPNLRTASTRELRRLAKWLLAAAVYIEGKKRG